MPMSALLESVPDVGCAYHHPDPIMAAILGHLEEQTVISLDSLVSLMPHCTWNQIFHEVDRLARCNKVVLRRHRFDYMLFSTHFVA